MSSKNRLDNIVGYVNFLQKVKALVREERYQVVLQANTRLTLLYWKIGRGILVKQAEQGWGAKVIDRLSKDLKQAFPEMKGFSPRNLKYMRKFAEHWPDPEIVQQVAAQIPWTTNMVLLDKLPDQQQRMWYAVQAKANGWSRNVLNLQIDNQLHLRQGAAQSNFSATMPSEDSGMAVQLFKSPYLFDFIGTDAPRREAELEARLIDHLEKFLLELGQGFAFVGRQVRLEVEGDEFFADLLFYHLKLRCYVVIELKMGRFKPEYVGQLNFYQNVINAQMCHPDDKGKIGLLLVREKNQLVVEYVLQGSTQPLGVAEWREQLTHELPKELEGSLPTIEQIERELEKDKP